MAFTQHQRMPFNVPQKAQLRRSGKAPHPFIRGRIWLVLFSVLVGVIFGTGGIPRPVFAGSVVACSSTSPNFCWEGGAVQHHPHIYLTFWGPKWASDPDHEQIIIGLEAVFRHFAGRQYTNILTQYGDDPNNHDSTIHNDFDMPAIPAFDLSTPGANLNPLDVVGEVLKEWPNADPDNQFLVFPQEGTTYLQFNGKDFCGMHANNAAGVVFGLIKYASDDPGCNFVDSVVTAHPANLVNDMVWTAVHEVAEMATDPRPIPASPSWKTKGSSSLDPTEVADLCQTWLPGQNTPTITFVDYPDTYHFYLPYLWSNNSNTCILAEGQEFSSVDQTYPFRGIHTVQGLILGKYQSLGGPSGWLAGPTSEETPIAGGVVSYFAGGGSCGGNGPNHSCGAIYYRGGAGTHVIWAGIYQKYISLGDANGWQGFPTTDELGISNGRVQYFAGGGACGGSGPNGSCSAIYYSDQTGAHIVWAGIYQKYVSLGEANGWQGFPTTDELGISNGRVQYFAGGGACGGSGPNGSCSAIYYSDQTGAHIVWAGIYQTFLHLGGPGGMLGFPTTDEQGIANGRVQYFFKSVCGSYGPNGSTSALYYLDGIGSYEVHGCIYAKYASIGGPQGKMGFPVSNEYINASGYPESDFQNGYIIWQNGTAVTKYFCPPAC